MKRITIEPVSRIEGHAKISIQLDDQGHVANTEFSVTQVRGFEKFTEGHPFYEMPGITARICGICPVSHLLASAKACDAIMAVRIPPVARKLREVVHYAQIAQSHALSFFYLSAPDFLLGMDSDPASRNVLGVIAGHPELAREGIELRKFGLLIVEGLAQERVHPSWIVPVVSMPRFPVPPATVSSPSCRRRRELLRELFNSSKVRLITTRKRSSSLAPSQPCTPAWWM